jgi:hypothetical protein
MFKKVAGCVQQKAEKQNKTKRNRKKQEKTEEDRSRQK